MCGIAGTIDFQADARRHASVCDDMITRLKRRGPDEDGRYLSENACLVHARLAVVDVEHGKQPMIERAGENDIVLVYNGELYNTEDLRRELTALGHKFRERSDTEALLRAYTQWGEDCVERLNGIFAFAVWDGRERKLFAARDRMGVKPFFYAFADGAFVFASEIKALLRYPGVRPVIDRNGAAELLLLGPGRTPGRGVFKGISELKPGWRASFTESGGFREERYWKLTGAEHKDGFEETVETTRVLLADAIRRQTVSDVPLCAFLSGGIDSSAIVALSGVKRVFSVDYAENDKYFQANAFQPGSDKAYIAEMVDYLGLTHTNITLETDELVDALFEAVEARDLPGMADVDSSLLLFCRAVKKEATVALSGECADELFGGYPWYRNPETLKEASFPWAKRTAYRLSFVRDGVLDGVDPEAFIRERYDATADDADVYEADSDDERALKRMVRLNTDWFMQTLLDRKDRMSMFSGLEVRVPFCDHRIAEYLYNVPSAFKNFEGREKGLLREALTGALPESVRLRKKSPYPKTHHPEYMKRVSEMLLDILASANSPLLEIADRSALSAAALSKGENSEPWYGQLMTAPQTIAYFIQLNYWMIKYGVEIDF